MVSGSVSWIPNIKDGWVFLMEPVHPIAAVIVDNAEGLPTQPLAHDLFALGTLLLVSSLVFSLAARVALLPGRRLRRAT
jgi:ABC-type phosphate transport system permease subunit